MARTGPNRQSCGRPFVVKRYASNLQNPAGSTACRAGRRRNQAPDNAPTGCSFATTALNKLLRLSQTAPGQRLH